MAKIFVLGSLNMDLVINAERFPNKGETIKGTDFFINEGGKGLNQAVACAKMGAETYMIGTVGCDEYGKKLIKALKTYGVKTKYIQKIKHKNSGIALITVCDGENKIIVNSGANALINFAKVEKILNTKTLPGDILILQQEIPLDIVEKAIAIASKKYVKVILNPAPAAKIKKDLYKKVDLIIPNETETEILTEICPDDEVSIKLAIQSLHKLGVKNVAITLGSKGAVISAGKEIEFIPAKIVKVVDTTGAGDTFVGVVAVMLQEGKSLSKSANFANTASALKITRKGAAKAIPTYTEVLLSE
ncbi:MAG: ribokinase [Clostridia bacterium]|jgi:ribokinase|nr:ribokinase [Clostridia bacterium]